MKLRNSIFTIAALFLLTALLGGSCGNGSRESAGKTSVSEIVNGMTLEQKIGQMIMMSVRTFSTDGEQSAVTKLPPELAEAIRRMGFGGFILFSENCVDAEQLIRLTDALREASAMPPLIAIDQEGGRVTRIPFMTTMCGNMALAATDNPAENARISASIIARELAALGINVNLAPVADVNSEPSNPVIGVRSFSDDPKLAARYAAAYAEGLHSEGIIAAYKHFPGHGDTNTDSHIGLPLIDKDIDALRKCELIPFAEGIAAGADMIMTAHIRFPKIESKTWRSRLDGSEITLPATLSGTLITDLLRGEMGYDGVVITDALAQMDAIVKHFTPLDAIRLAINAGADILLIPVDMTDGEKIAEAERLMSETARMARSGEIDINRIDSAVRRIVSLKLKMGLTDSMQTTDIEERIKHAHEAVGCAEHRDIERRITRNAITLLRAEDGAFPMHPASGDRVVIAYPSENIAETVEAAAERMKLSGLLPPDTAFLCYGTQDPNDTGVMLKAKYIVLITDVANLGDMSSPIAERAAGIASAAAESGAHLLVISSRLPCDVQLYPEADAVIAAYMPFKGPNIPEAIAAAFGEFIPTGHLPINIMKLRRDNDGGFSFTDEVLYPRRD